MSTRRSLLISVSALGTVSLTGCSAFSNRGTTNHKLRVINGSQEQHYFPITATNEDGEAIFEETLDLEGGTADEDLVIEGTPAEISVTVDFSEPETLSWDPQTGAGNHSGECPGENTLSLTIWYEQMDGDGVKPIFGCEYVQDQ